jgi:hypothetical protein
MASGAVILYASNKDDLNINDIVGATVKLAFVSSAYTPDATVTGHDEWADVSANEIAATGGLSAGGLTVGTKVATAITGGFKFASANPSITATGAAIGAWRYGVLYVSGSLWGKTNPLIGYFVGDSTPADVPATADGATLTVACPSGGWFDAV